MINVLAQQDATLEAWSLYARRGSLCDKLLRAPVYRAWERAHVQHANCKLFKAECLPERDTNRLIQTKQDLIDAAQPYMAILSRAAGHFRHAAMLGDENSVVLSVQGDEASVHGPEAVPGPGAILTEALSGANGIGTPLAEGDYIELVGTEHFIQGFHPFTCQGLPLYGPDRKIAGCLSTSVRDIGASRRLRSILFCAAKSIENELLQRQMFRNMQQLLSSSVTEKTILESLRQDIVQAQAIGLIGLEEAAQHFSESDAEYTQRLTRMAAQAIERSHAESRLWLDLAESTDETPEVINVFQLLQNLLGLMRTEASLRGIEIIAKNFTTYTALLPRKQTTRNIFNSLLQSFDRIGTGQIEIEMVHLKNRKHVSQGEGCEIRFHLHSLDGNAGSVLQPIALFIPTGSPSLPAEMGPQP